MNKIVSWIFWSPWRLVLLVSILVAIVVTWWIWPSGKETVPTAPSSSSAEPSATSAAVFSSSAEPSRPASQEASMSVSVVDEAGIEVAGTYLNARANATSAARTSPTDWVDEVKQVVTPEWESVLRERAFYGWEWDIFHEGGWHVEISDIQCEYRIDSYREDAKERYVSCRYRALLTTADGPVVDPPFGWREHPNILLTLVRDGDRWRVQDESEGSAG